MWARSIPCGALHLRACRSAVGRAKLKLPLQIRHLACLSGHRKFTVATNIDVHFRDPRSPWQRGSNENANCLLRQYFPKGTDISEFSQAKLSVVERPLNKRPRKTMHYETPAEKFEVCVAATRLNRKIKRSIGQGGLRTGPLLPTPSRSATGKMFCPFHILPKALIVPDGLW